MPAVRPSRGCSANRPAASRLQTGRNTRILAKRSRTCLVSIEELMKSRFLIPAVALLAIGAFAYAVMSTKRPVLTAVTWAGAYGRAQASALFFPYTQQTRVDLRIAEYDGGLEELRARVASKRYGWDVIDMELPDAIAACEAGLLERIDAATLPAGANGEP